MIPPVKKAIMSFLLVSCWELTHFIHLTIHSTIVSQSIIFKLVLARKNCFVYIGLTQCFLRATLCPFMVSCCVSSTRGVMEAHTAVRPHFPCSAPPGCSACHLSLHVRRGPGSSCPRSFSHTCLPAKLLVIPHSLLTALYYQLRPATHPGQWATTSSQNYILSLQNPWLLDFFFIKSPLQKILEVLLCTVSFLHYC